MAFSIKLSLLKRIPAGVQVALLLLCLAACGGGGGGGSNGGGGVAPDLTPPAATFDDGPTTPVSGAANILSAGNDPNNISFKFNDPDVTMTATTNSISYSYDGEQLMVFLVSQDFAQGDNYIAAQKTTGMLEGVSESTGDDVRAKLNVALFLGGKELNLQYCDFGLWAGSIQKKMYDPASGALTDQWSGLDFIDPFWAESSSSGNKAAPTAGQTFTGNTIAVAHAEPSIHGFEEFAVISGDATLKLQTGSTVAADLTLAFDKYYTFTINGLSVNGSGGIGDVGGSTSFNVSGSNQLGNSALNIATLDASESYVQGQIYGATAGTPSESAGLYDLRDSSANVNVSGAFGVKAP